jgi:hypothetical protein
MFPVFPGVLLLLLLLLLLLMLLLLLLFLPLLRPLPRRLLLRQQASPAPSSSCHYIRSSRRGPLSAHGIRTPPRASA